MNERGEVLTKAIKVINGERQDQYGSPEDSFWLIAEYWNLYINGTGDVVLNLGPEDVAMMMVLFKIARESNQHKTDNVVDAAGYLGIYGDMAEQEKPFSEQMKSWEASGQLQIDPLQNPELDEVGK